MLVRAGYHFCDTKYKGASNLNKTGKKELYFSLIESNTLLIIELNTIIIYFDLLKKVGVHNSETRLN